MGRTQEEIDEMNSQMLIVLYPARGAAVPISRRTWERDWSEKKVADNDGKSAAFYDSFFPRHPGQVDLPELDPSHGRYGVST